MLNVGTLDRILRAIVGLVLIVAPFAAGWPMVVLLISVVVGAVLAATAAISFCPIYALLGLSSKQGRLGKICTVHGGPYLPTSATLNKDKQPMWPFSGAGDTRLRFRQLDPNFAVAGQISVEDIPKIAEAGFETIVCARPDNEEPGQPRFAEIAAAARKIGIEAVHIPVSGGVGEGQLIRLEQALKTLPTPMFGYCRSGARAGSLFSAAKSLA